jgi:hypothetical protein
MTNLTTELNLMTIVDAINVVSEAATQKAIETNKFAAAMLDTDLDEAESILLQNSRLIEATKVLLQLSDDILPE